MLHAYVDESYSNDWFFMVAAVTADQASVRQLDMRLREIVRVETERLAIPRAEEVHGYELFQGVGDWGKVKVADRLGVAGQVFEALRDSDVQFIIRGLDRAAQRRRYPEAYEPYPMILTHLMRATNDYAEERRDKVRIVCDEIHQHDRHRAMLNRHRVQGTPGFKKSNLSAVVGELGFVTSTSSPMIQAADIVAYLRHRIASVPNPSREERRSRARLWRVIEGQIKHDFCWVP